VAFPLLQVLRLRPTVTPDGEELRELIRGRRRSAMRTGHGDQMMGESRVLEDPL
jgi:hypothetical protein